ncbi:MAG: glycosyltransferase [Chloroflexi bacterium]|nr:MAG: glycosyltransferase [Chloroflexota bacterium]
MQSRSHGDRSARVAPARPGVSEELRWGRPPDRGGGLALHAVDAPAPPGRARARGLCPGDHAPLHVVRRIGGMIAITLGVLLTASLALFGFGVNLLFLTWRAIHLQPRPGPLVARGSETRLCVQIPIYNERYVAERVLDAVCELDWPTALLEIQVLDDSDDETSSILARRVAHWRRRGLKLTQVRRESREGFKAGALAHGLALTDAPFIAIFDADFVPPRDFLRRTLAVFDDPTVGFAQARWGHLNESYSWFTRLQALAIDFHFLVEQSVRAAQSYFTNFTGTAGVWRRTAIEDSGGWSAATLTEDLDLSYRAQLRGWRGAYLEDLVVPEELPVSIDAYRRQQSRWATGSFQSAFRLLVPILRSRNRPAVKLQAAVHLLSYGVGPLMLAQLACYPLLLLAFDPRWLPWQLADASVLVTVIGASPWIGFMVAQTRRGRPWWSGLPSVLCQVVGAGMSLTVVVAMVRATRSGGEFVRTPKHHIVQRGQEWRHQDYVHVGDPRALAEALLGVAALMIASIAIYSHQSLVAIYACLFALGFLTLTSLSAIDFLEVVTLRGLGHRALTRLRLAAPSLVLLSFCAVLLLLAAAYRGQPCLDRAPAGSAVRNAGLVAPRLPPFGGRRPQDVRAVVARFPEGPGRLDRAGHPRVRLWARTQPAPSPVGDRAARAQPGVSFHIWGDRRRAAADGTPHRRCARRGARAHEGCRPAGAARMPHCHQGLDLDWSDSLGRCARGRRNEIQGKGH